jgi:hypothetical protein
MKTDKAVQVKKWLTAAEQGDAKALQKVRTQMPEYRQYVLDQYGDLGKATEWAVLTQLSGENLLFQDGLQEKVQALRQDLEGPDPSPLERLLIDRIVCCWLFTQFNELKTVVGNPSPKQREHYERSSNRATRRFLAACKTLAQVRKLLGPTIQINVAERQVNVA